MTVAEALRQAADSLRAAGVASSERDAERLLRHVLGWDRARLITSSAEELPAPDAARFQSLVAERQRRRPLQHLTGTQAFWRHDFLVTPDVLIPRPESELIVEAALEVLRDVQHPIVVDVGTGSGCLALSVAAERADADVHATDASAAALAVARENAARLGLRERVTFHGGDLLTPVMGLARRVDLVMSNPPYVDPDAIRELAPEVRDHEPRAALVPGDDAFAIYRRLAPQAGHLLRAGGWLVLEIGVGMEAVVKAVCGAAGFEVVRVAPDLQGIPRTVVAHRR